MAHIEVEGDELVIRVPLNVTPTPSSTGKTNTIDTTHGFTQVSTPFGQASVSLNVCTKLDAKNWKLPVRTAPAAPGLVKRA